MKPRLLSVRFRRAAAHLVAALVAGLLFASLTGTASGQTQAAAVDIKGAGSWGPYRETVDWQNALADAGDAAAPQIPINLDYTNNGSKTGREGFLNGDADFALSGVPFTDDELKSLPNGNNDLIAAPLNVTALGFLVADPNEGFLAIKSVPAPCDPLTDADQCVQVAPYTDPLKIPDENLAAMVLRLGQGRPQVNAWDHPNVLAANSVEGWTTATGIGPGPVVRSDADESTFYLQQFIKSSAPKTWANILSGFHQYQWEPITERWPRVIGNASRDGLEQESAFLGQGGIDPFTGSLNQVEGTIAPVEPSTKEQVLETFPQAQVRWGYMQNANGDWVAPSPDTINAAVDAGGDTPLYALTNKVANAYPMVWVDKMYVKASGLSADKTEALATIVRYVATAGQSVMAQHNDGRLSTGLVKEALDAADQIIKSNCKGSGHELVQNTDIGRFAPKVDAMKSIGKMYHCNATAAAAPSTTTTPPTTFAPFNSSFDSTSNIPLTPLPALPASTQTATPTDQPDAKKSDTATAALAASKLPLDEPSSSAGSDAKVAMILGALLYLALQGPARRLLGLGSE